MNKSKLTGGIAVSPESSPALRTRAAKTLALQRLNRSFSQSSSSFLQLRSRRLQKPPAKALPDGDCFGGRVGLECSSADSRLNSASVGSGLEKRKVRVETEGGNFARDFEDCSGENCLQFGGENWGTAEKIRTISMRMETNSHTSNSGVELLKSIPTANDIDEFFAHEELWHQRTFIQKYNFNFASETPLQGRYEWVQVVP